MQLHFDKSQCFAVPEKLYCLLADTVQSSEIPNNNFSTIIFSFNNSSYSAKSGGYHPVEICIKQHERGWQFVYITDFSYQGLPFPELEKEVDVCFHRKQVFSLYGGWLNDKSGKELIQLFLSNFIAYHAEGVYQTSVAFQ